MCEFLCEYSWWLNADTNSKCLNYGVDTAASVSWVYGLWRKDLLKPVLALRPCEFGQVTLSVEWMRKLTSQQPLGSCSRWASLILSYNHLPQVSALRQRHGSDLTTEQRIKCTSIYQNPGWLAFYSKFHDPGILKLNVKKTLHFQL